MEESKDASARYDKRILVTGGAGFIGSHVVLLLVKKYPNYKIINFDKLDYCSSLKNLQEIENEPNYEFIKGSINSSDLLNYVMKQERIDTVLHFAAQTHVDNSFGNSVTFTETNVLGTHMLLEASRVNKVKLFVHVSTDEVYGEGDVGEAGMGVSATLEPTNPYAASKAGAEYLVKAYHRSFKLPVIITRGNNVYGPHQYPEKIIPKFINQLARGLPCTLHGNGLNTRNYLYVKDVARAFDTILHKAKPGDVVNIGGRYEISNLTVAKTLIDIIAYSSKPGEALLAEALSGGETPTTLDDQGKPRVFGGTVEVKSLPKPEVEGKYEKYIKWVEDRPFNDLRYPLDCRYLQALGWREEVSWEEGIQETVTWYAKNPSIWLDLGSALVAHPRRGLTSQEVLGHSDTLIDEEAKELADIAEKSATHRQ